MVRSWGSAMPDHCAGRFQRSPSNTNGRMRIKHRRAQKLSKDSQTLTGPCAQVTSTWSTFGHRPLTHRCVILTTNRQVPPAVVLCSSVRRTDSPSAFLTGSERAPVAHRCSLVRGSCARRSTHGAGTDARKPRSASMHRWGRPTQRKKTQPSTSNIGEADRRCTRFEYGQRGPHGPRESESRHPVTNPGLSDLRSQLLLRGLLGCAPTCETRERRTGKMLARGSKLAFFGRLEAKPGTDGRGESQRLPRATSIWHFELYDGKMGLRLQELGGSGCDGD